MREGLLGQMWALAGGTRIEPGVAWGADNGCFSRAWNPERWWSKIQTLPRDALFVVAPDVVGDAEATAALARPWLPRIRAAGFPVAYVAQDGAADLPWDEFDWLFVGGSTEFKLSPEAQRLAREARERGKRTHMGRVNSLRRLRFAAAHGYDTVDGTYLAFGPDLNLPRLLGFLRHADHPRLWNGAKP